MKLYRLHCWRFGREHFCAGYPTASFVARRSAAEKYTRQQAADLKRRFRKVKLALRLEEVTEAERRSGEPMSDKARQLLMFD
jgi:hypothetical protein